MDAVSGYFQIALDEESSIKTTFLLPSGRYCCLRIPQGLNAEAGMVAHPVTEVIGEQALLDIPDLSEVAWTCWGCFYTQQLAGAEDGEGIRPAAGNGNE